MSDRVLFVQGLAHKLLEQWPAGVSADDALGLVVGLTELAFPPEPEAPPAEIPATLALSPEGAIEGALQLGAGGVNLVGPRWSLTKPPSPIDALPEAMATADAELEEAVGVMEAHGRRYAEALERDLLEEEVAESQAELAEQEAIDPPLPQALVPPEGGGARDLLEQRHGCGTSPAQAQRGPVLAGCLRPHGRDLGGGDVAAGEHAEEAGPLVSRGDRPGADRAQRVGELARRGDLT